MATTMPSKSAGYLTTRRESEMDRLGDESTNGGNEDLSTTAIEDTVASIPQTLAPNSTATTAGHDDGTTDPYAGLSDDQVAVLKRQVETPELTYGFWHIYHYATKLDLVIILVASVASCASGAAMPGMTLIFGGLQGAFQDYLALKTITEDEFQRIINRSVLYFVYLAVGSFFATYISTVGFMYTGEHITTNLRQQYLESCLRQNIGFFDKVSAGDVAAKITVDANRIQNGISEKVGLLLTSLATLIAGFVIGFIVSWKLTLIMSSVFIALLLNTAIWGTCIMRNTQRKITVAVKASTLAQEIFSAVRVAIAFGSQQKLVKQYDGHLKSSQGYDFRIRASIGMMLAVFMGIMPLTYGLGFWQGSLFLARGEITIEKMLTTILTVMIGSFNVGAIGPYLQAYTDAVSTASRLMVVIDRETPLDGTDDEGGEKPSNVEGELRLKAIGHVYPSRPNVVVLDDVSLKFEAGKMTALVGASGSGKSTIFGLIERFYEPIQGSVFLDNRDISTLSLRWLRQQIGVVGQEPVLFAGSIHDNIRNGLIGSPHESVDENIQHELVIEAAKKANAHDFISQLADGYDTDVGQRGLLLSGGQKQRIAIARAIVSNPKILLLDEATSALDTKSEALVHSALEQASQGRTTILIAHRLSTVRNAHKIIVLAKGNVVEQGSHDELLLKKGAYSELVNSQQLSQSDKDSVVAEENEKPAQDSPHKSFERSLVDDTPVHPSLRPSSALSPYVAALDIEQVVAADTRYNLWTLIKFIFNFNRPETLWMVLASTFCVMGGLATPVQSVFFAKQLTTLSHIESPLYDRWQVRHDSNFWSLMFLMLGIVTFLAYVAQSVTFAHTAEALIRRVRCETMKHLLRQDVSFFDESRNSPSALTAYLALETMQLASMSGANLGNLLTSLTIVIGGISLSLAIGWKLALVCLSVVPLLICCSICRFFILRKYEGRASRVYVDSASYAAENIVAIRTVASLTMEKQIADQYKATVGKQRKDSLKSVAKSGAFYAASQSFILLCLGLAFWYGSTLMVSMEYSIFQFFVCLMSVIFGTQSAGTMLAFIPDLVKARHSAAQLKVLFDAKPLIDTREPSQRQSLEKTAGRLELRNVHFSYPTRPGKPVIRGIDLVVEPGQRVALVGASGCGKSTIISLLERFYDPTAGQILIDGVDVTSLHVNDYRSFLALVSQEPALFQGTIKDNIVIGSPEESVSEDALKTACQDANIYDFIISLPDGFYTDLGSAGALLSGGQKQRIAIARALLRHPRILLLDEATSALDSESERVIQNALDRASKGRTTVTVAHRLTTIRNADRIVVIDEGRIAEQGTHDQLMVLNGIYAELARLQSLES